MKVLRVVAVCLLLCQFNIVFSQETYLQYKKDIDAFKSNDSIVPPPQNSILFVGSSSLTIWTDIINYFPGYPIINRGFGGSTLLDVIHYVHEIIIDYKPKKIFIYCGENDIASSDTISPLIVFTRFKKLYNDIRNGLGGEVEINYISIKPSISRWSMEKRMLEANSLIAEFLKSQTHTNFIDVHSSMLDKNGDVLKDIFIKDNLHINAKGYKIWQKIIVKFL